MNPLPVLRKLAEATRAEELKKLRDALEGQRLPTAGMPKPEALQKPYLPTE